jgi:hypothetical protein
MGTKNKRSPLKDSFLRHAGQSLDEKIYEVVYEKILPDTFIVLVLIGWAVIEWLRAYFKIPYNPLAITSLVVLMSLYYGFNIARRFKELKNLKLGRDGERAVGEVLDELRKSGYKVYHDVVEDTFNIDHIIVGPAGVFTVETKTIRKVQGTNPTVNYDGSRILVDGFTPDRDPIKQAMGQKYWLEDFIARNTRQKVVVKPIVIYPGWFVNNKNRDSEVWVLNEKALSTFLANAPEFLSAEKINLISSHIESFVRNN